MRVLRRKVNSFTLFSFALFGVLLYILDTLNKVGIELEYSNSQTQIANEGKSPIENLDIKQENHVDENYADEKDTHIEKNQAEENYVENQVAENESGKDESPKVQSSTVNGDHHLQLISDCSCRRSFMYPPLKSNPQSEDEFTRYNSSCSDQGTFYQTNQNVITFSLSVKFASSELQKKYEMGLVQNMIMMRKHYPGYSLRLYTDFAPYSHYCKILCDNEDLFWCNIVYSPSLGNLTGMVFRTWRFLTLGDPTVDVFLSRDLDSLISAREAAVVEDWLFKGDKAISLMRDRPGGHNFSMLAGLWEASNNKLGMDRAVHIRDRIIDMSKWSNETHKTSDQEILDSVVFQWESENIVAYDSYNCVKWANYTLVRPFPMQRGDPTRDFVGNRVDFEGTGEWRNYTAIECPGECRPIYGRNWTYC